MLRIKTTFLDEITHDIPALNYLESDWDEEFGLMKQIGIERVIMIRCGNKNHMTFPSQVLHRTKNAFMPPEDLVEMFLRLAEKNGLKFIFGTYNSGNDWLEEKYDANMESDLMNAVNDEFFERYGRHSKAFGGWYLSQEISSSISYKVVECYKQVGRHVKSMTPDLPIIISPGFCRDFKNAEEHRQDWDGIFREISGIVDIVAFQDGHVALEKLEEYLKLTQEIAMTHKIKLWTNLETFDRDIPGAFPPIRYDKLHIKMDAAEHAGITEALTFDFSHFLSPKSGSVGSFNLLKKYCRRVSIECPLCK